MPTGDTAPAELSCPEVDVGVEVGRVEIPELTEASGLAARDGRLWVHNDSGAPSVFVISETGEQEAIASVQTVVVDWEDAAWRQGALWIADIGDNATARTHVTLLEVPVDETPTDGAVWTPRTVQLTWPSGPVDSETLLADPDGDLLLVPKVFDGDVHIHRVVDPEAAESELEEVAALAFGTGALAGNTLVTGGDIAPDGGAVVLRTYLDAFVWPRRPGEPWSATFAREPCRIDLQVEPQGETIAWGDDDALYTVSEGQDPVLWRYEVRAR
jgi:hypothetical protein